MSRLRLGDGAFLSGWPYYCMDIVETDSDYRQCFRAAGHSGRHASITIGGTVTAVWGEDVHADKRRAAA